MRASRGWSSTARASAARSIAHEWLPASTKPSTRREVRAAEAHRAVRARSSRATKARELPATFCASAMRRVVAGRQQQPVEQRLQRARACLFGSSPTREPGACRASLVIAHHRLRRLAVHDEQRGHHLRQRGDGQDRGRVAPPEHAPGVEVEQQPRARRPVERAHRVASGASSLTASGVGAGPDDDRPVGHLDLLPAAPWAAPAAPARGSGAPDAAAGDQCGCGDGGGTDPHSSGGCRSAPTMPNPNMREHQQRQDREDVRPALDRARGPSAPRGSR